MSKDTLGDLLRTIKTRMGSCTHAPGTDLLVDAALMLHEAAQLQANLPGLGEISDRAQNALTHAQEAENLCCANRDSIERINKRHKYLPELLDLFNQRHDRAEERLLSLEQRLAQAAAERDDLGTRLAKLEQYMVKVPQTLPHPEEPTPEQATVEKVYATDASGAQKALVPGTPMWDENHVEHRFVEYNCWADEDRCFKLKNMGTGAHDLWHINDISDFFLFDDPTQSEPDEEPNLEPVEPLKVGDTVQVDEIGAHAWADWFPAGAVCDVADDSDSRGGGALKAVTRCEMGYGCEILADLSPYDDDRPTFTRTPPT